ncbi:MAG: hypothetical protein ACTSPY_02125 [Candidatus Helarchaeota archaeon]
MTKSIKIRDDLKREIEKLEAKIFIKQNRKLTQQEILQKLLKFSLKFVDNIFGSLEDTDSYEDDYAWKMLEKPLKWGIKDASIETDKYIYR